MEFPSAPIFVLTDASHIAGNVQDIFSNYTEDHHDPGGPELVDAQFFKSQEAFIYFALFFSPIILVTNVIVMVSSCLMIRDRREPKCAYICMCNISLADVIICAAILIGVVELKSANEKYFCASQLGSIITGNLASMLSICLIAIERYLYIVHGIKLDSYLTRGKTGALIILVWATGVSFGMVPILVEASHTPGNYVDVCEFITSPDSVIITAVILAIPSLVFVPLVYAAVYRHVRRVTQKMANSSKIPALKYKSILVVLLSSISFLICWGPFIFCVVLYKFYCFPHGMKCRNLTVALASPLACLGFVNALLNPIIYAWWHPPYNNALKKVLCPEGRRAKSRGSLFQKPNDTLVETISA